MASSAPYLNCFHCRAPFNALTTNWCSCLTTERSLVCPTCLRCFCNAPAAFKEGFWETAPRALLDRKREEHSKPFPTAGLPDGAELRRPLVLVVDDEPGILRLATRAVKGSGFGVLWCDNAVHALELIRQYHPDVVLTDVVMPQMDGRELCRQVKQDPALAGTRVIVMSGVYTSDNDVIRGRQMYGVDDYLAKPFRFAELGAVLRRHTGDSV
jgi:CheY-like chemotaxis protein